MKPFEECALCIVKWIYERLSVSADEEQKYEIMRTIMDVLSHEFMPSANVALISKKILGTLNEFVPATETHYSGIKTSTNHIAKGLLPASKEFIRKGGTSSERLKRACLLASAGNVSTVGAPKGAYEFSEIEEIIMDRTPVPLLMGDVFGAVERANHILFLVDNAGEIGFDSLLIEELKAMGLEITLVVKEDPFFEDATMEDACYFNLDNLADNILTTRSVFVPGNSTPPLEEAYRKSDLIIAKGVFNFESLADDNPLKPVIYLLKMKCRLLCEITEAEMGNAIVRLENP